MRDVQAVAFAAFAAVPHRQSHLKWAYLLEKEEAERISRTRPGEALVFLSDDGSTVLTVNNPYYGGGRFPLVLRNGLTACWSARTRLKDVVTGKASEWEIRRANMPCGCGAAPTVGAGSRIESWCVTDWRAA